MTELVGTFASSDPRDLLAAYRSEAARICDRIEVRIDAGCEHAVEALVAAARRDAGKPVLATVRGRADDPARLALLRRAVAAGADWADVEHDAPDSWVAALRDDGARVLRSAHVPRLPADLPAFAARLREGADAVKIVGLSGGAAECVRLLDVIRGGGVSGHLSTSWFSRAASAACGAPIAFAALRPGLGLMATLPTVRWFLDRARLRTLARGRPLFVLLGSDVDASVSPDMLNASFDSGGPDAVALRWSCDDPRPALDAILRFGWIGAAVTIPHKETVAAALVAAGGRLDASAARVGAVNTVVREGSVLAGHNTDSGGLLDALGDAAVRGGTMLVLGAGGAARAAVAAAEDAGMRAVVHARSPSRARAWGAVTADADEAAALAPAVVVDATPAGPPGGVAAFDVSRLPAPAVVLDMLVSARPTAILRDADRAGHRGIPGFEMLLAQAARQVRLLGGAPDVASMRYAGETQLALRDANVVLVGLRGAGKTVVGRVLGALLGRAVTDTDEAVKDRLGASPSALIASGREAEFRAAERRVLLELSERTGIVVSTGGGAALHEEALRALAATGPVILLDAPDAVLAARIAGSERPPLTALPPAEECAALRAARMPVYERLATLRIDTSCDGSLNDGSGVAGDLAIRLDALGIRRIRPDADDLPGPGDGTP